MLTITSILKAGVQSSVIMTMADVGTQLLEKDVDADSNLDLHRTLRWTLAGLLLHGPFFYAGFSMLDRRFGAAATLKVVAAKTASAQFILFPPYLVALFGFMGALENHPNIVEKIKTKVPAAFASGCVYWPIANTINFAVVPPAMRVPYVATSAGVWNSYLSWTNSKKDTAPDLPVGSFGGTIVK
eukprot:Nitzschia sp. Nitz4//scaffold7_size249615//202268//202822//NITZ4_001204-RA/size249615-processed-gene-0.157-mRNA-1//1//CDS//3329558523//9284//frame0